MRCYGHHPTSPRGYNFQSHLEWLKFTILLRVNLININFFCGAKINKCDRAHRTMRWKQTNERAHFSMFCFVLNTLNYENSRYTLVLLSIQIYRIFQPVYGNLCSRFFFVNYKQFVRSLVRSPIWHKTTTTATTATTATTQIRYENKQKAIVYMRYCLPSNKSWCCCCSFILMRCRCDLQTHVQCTRLRYDTDEHKSSHTHKQTRKAYVSGTPVRIVGRTMTAFAESAIGEI